MSDQRFGRKGDAGIGRGDEEETRSRSSRRVADDGARAATELAVSDSTPAVRSVCDARAGNRDRVTNSQMLLHVGQSMLSEHSPFCVRGRRDAPLPPQDAYCGHTARGH